MSKREKRGNGRGGDGEKLEGGGRIKKYRDVLPPPLLWKKAKKVSPLTARNRPLGGKATGRMGEHENQRWEEETFPLPPPFPG